MNTTSKPNEPSWNYPVGTRLVFNDLYMDDGAFFPKGSVLYSDIQLKDGSVKAFLESPKGTPLLIPASHVSRILDYLDEVENPPLERFSQA